MAVTADYLVLPNGMPVGTKGLRAFVLVAGIANFCLGRAFKYLVWLVNRMAIVTGKAITFVNAGMPLGTPVSLVAVKTDGITNWSG